MTDYKKSFVDEYPYLVYTNEHTIVYSDKPDTSIDDIGGGGGDVPTGFYFIANENGTLNKTWSEINTMYDSGANWVILPPVVEGVAPEYVSECGEHGGDYGVVLTNFTDSTIEHVYLASSADGYPVLVGQS